MNSKELKKAKQAGRREARAIMTEHLESLEPEYFSRKFINSRPKWVPGIIRKAIVKWVVNFHPGGSIRVSITGKDYMQLIKGELVYKNGVKIVLKDIGYTVMEKMLKQAMKG